MKKTFFFSCMMAICFSVSAQKITPEQYIDTYKDLAILEMQRTGIPASVTLAQGLLETECGNSELVKMSNNHFGIKCRREWTGETVLHTDDAPNECFRKYPKAEDSYKDHSNYLKNSARYASLFQLDPSDYKGWAYGLKRAGYATNPRYPQILITNIERYNLQQYDTILMRTELAVENNNNTNPPTESVTTAPMELPLPVKDEPEPLIKPGTRGKMNGLRTVFVTKGTSLLAIATINDVPLLKLQEYNELTQDGLSIKDQWLYLEKKYKSGPESAEYTAPVTQSLYEIGQLTGIQLRSLSDYNNISPSAVVAKGTVIKLRSSSSNDSK